MTTSTLATALADLLAVADRARDDVLTRPTPCAGWDVRRLLEHVVGWQRVFAACARDTPPPFDGDSPTYRASTDVVADLRVSSADLLHVLDTRQLPVDLPYRGPIPVLAHVEELVAETVLHTWDLATAVDVDRTPGSDVLAVAHRGLTRLLAESFAPVAFAPGTESGPAGAPDESGPSDLAALVARSGRTG